MIKYYCQQYTCESGAISRILIPENASQDDLEGIKEMLNVIIQRHFKVDGGTQHEN